MPHPLIELGGRGELVVLLPANGFPPESYIPAMEPLFARHRVVSLPPRALWEAAGPAPERPGSWLSLAEDLLAGWRLHALPSAVCIGHSFGAVTGLLAAVREPARVRALALLDPTIFPPALLAEFAEQRQSGAGANRQLVRGALTRRDRFASLAEAFAHWRGKPLFADWSDEALRRYAAAMLRPASDGSFTLRWRPDWEAHYYQSIYTDTWEEVDRLDPALAMLVVRGERSDTYLPEAERLLRARIPWARHLSLPGRGHLFPLAAPADTGRILLEWLEATGC